MFVFFLGYLVRKILQCSSLERALKRYGELCGYFLFSTFDFRLLKKKTLSNLIVIKVNYIEVYHVNLKSFSLIFIQKTPLPPIYYMYCIFDRQARATMALCLRIGSSSRSLNHVYFFSS